MCFLVCLDQKRSGGGEEGCFLSKYQVIKFASKWAVYDIAIVPSDFKRCSLGGNTGVDWSRAVVLGWDLKVEPSSPRVSGASPIKSPSVRYQRGLGLVTKEGPRIR